LGSIYCLYSTEDGMPRYVGQTEQRPDQRHKRHLTAALEMEKGSLYDWIRDVLRKGHLVEVYVLQEDVIPADLDLYEEYWIGSFPSLLNVRRVGPSPAEPTAVGRDIIAAIRRMLPRDPAT